METTLLFLLAWILFLISGILTIIKINSERSMIIIILFGVSAILIALATNIRTEKKTAIQYLKIKK